MPRSLEPGGTFDVWLDADAERTPRPTFQFRHMHARDWRKTVEISEQHDGEALARLDATFNALRLSLVGWSNMIADGSPVAFDPANLDLLLDPIEAIEIFHKVLNGGRLSNEEKKS